MDIVKELSLGKSFKSVPNGSLVAARNICIDENTNSIIRECGFDKVFSGNGEIVGVIPTTDYLVIFTYKDDKTSHIWILRDNVVKEVTGSGWNHIPNTRFEGTYTKNPNGDLVIVVSEHNDDGTLAYYNFPLRSWTIDTTGDNINYNFTSCETESICPTIPHFKCNQQIVNGGNLISGVYTFFIRFGINQYDYSNWFQITDDILIYNKILHSKPVHYYKRGDSEEVAETDNFKKFLVNKESYTPKGILLELSFNNDIIDVSKYSYIEVGYIFKHEANIVGRKISKNVIDGNNIYITCYDNNSIEEISIDEMVKEPNAFFNVNCLNNYNNRLYIANYETHNNNTLATSEYNILPKVSIKDYVDTDNAAALLNDENTCYITYSRYIDGGSTYSNQFEAKLEKDNDAVTKFGLPNGEYYKVTNETEFFNDVLPVDGSIGSFYNYAAESAKRHPGDWYSSDYYSLCDEDHEEDGYGTFWYENRDNGDGSSYGAQIHFELRLGDIGDKYLECIPLVLNGENLFSKVHVYVAKDKTRVYICRDTAWYDTKKQYITLPTSAGVTSNGFGNLGIMLCSQFMYKSSDGTISDAHSFAVNENISPWGDMSPYIVVRNALPYKENGGGNTGYINGSNYSAKFFNILAAKVEDMNVTDDTSRGSSDSSVLNVINIETNKTLVPYQHYNIFKHYVHKDMSVSLGYNVGMMYINERNEPRLYRLDFDKSIPSNSDIVGCIYTYEKVDKEIDWKIVHVADNQNAVTNCRFVYENLVYHYPYYDKFGDIYYVNDVCGKLIHNYSIIKPTDNGINITDATIPYITYTSLYSNGDTTYLYRNSVKTLYRISDYLFDCFDYTPNNKYLPGFYNREKTILYDKSIIGDISSQTIFHNQNKYVTYSISMIQDFVYSDIPIDCYVVKQDFEFYSQTLVRDNGDYIGTYNSNTVMPSKVNDFLEMPAAYISEPSKTYTNYIKDKYISRFYKTIYRSNQQGDENYKNSFREFEFNNYKIINENKGKITNIVGLGLTLLVHTEKSLFIFDRSPKLSSKLRSEIPDSFDVEYQEVFPNEVGYGGLQDNRECIVCPFGYIWYDNLSKTIYRYDNSQSDILSSDIVEFIKKLDIYTVRFAYTKDKRLLICIYYLPNGSESRSFDYCNTITLSYDTNTRKYISLHDYSFTRSYNTYNQTYLFNHIKSNDSLYVFNKDKVNYLELQDKVYTYIPTYSINGELASYIDFVITSPFEVTKVLESVSYVLHTIDKSLGMFDNITRLIRYSGDNMIIYTDSCYSGVLDIHVDNNNVNELDGYKYPYYEKGGWNINYFRNIISKENSNELPTTIIKYNNDTNKYEFAKIDMDKLKQDSTDNDVDTMNMSDDKSLIYGKYIVVRLIIDRNKDFKLKTIDVNLNKY